MASPTADAYSAASGATIRGGRFDGGALSGVVALDGAVAAGSISSTVPAAQLSGAVALDACVSGGNFAGVTAPPADWLARSTASDVVWAHNFEADEEVTEHLLVGATMDSVPARRVVDETGIGCLEQIALGASLAANFTAGSTTMVINDATHWPNPAVDGSFEFMVCRQDPSVGNKNQFLCTARSGTTLTVSYVDMTGNSAYTWSAQSYVIGDYAGAEASDWRRVFAALPAGENGKATDDPGASGAVPLRSKLSGNAYSVPRDASLWQYGWYGHAANQALWADWTGWQGASSLTPRGVSQGVGDKYRLWDGDEFYIQWRMKLDPRFYANHAQPDPNGTTGYWGRKSWAIQSELSSVNQIVAGVATSNRFSIPDTTKSPFGLSTYKAARVIGVSDYARSHISQQPNSPWDIAPHYANLSSSFKPSTGLATPDGSTAWELPDDEWITFYMRVKPGRSGLSETEIEVKFARTEDPAYDGTYTTLLAVSDANIVYSGSGDYDYPAGSFSYPTVTTMNALPGFQAFGLMGYFNITQSVGIPPPKASYYIRMAQVIFSQGAIAAPAKDWPFVLPASGAIGTISTNVLTDVTDGANENFSLSKVLGAWGSAAVSIEKIGSMVSDVVYWIFGGGHGDTANDAVYAWRASTGRFSRPLAPSAEAVTLMAGPSTNGTTDTTHGEDIFGRPDSQHAYGHLQALDSDDTHGPALMQLFGSGIGAGAIVSGQAHRFDGTTWERWANAAAFSAAEIAMTIKDATRQKFLRFPSNNGTAYYTLDYTDAAATWQALTQTARIGNWTFTYNAFGCHDPVRDLYIGGVMRGAGSNFCALDATAPGGAWVELTFTANAALTSITTAARSGGAFGGAGTYGLGLYHRAVDDTFVMIDNTTNPPTGVWVLTPPASSPLTNAWTWSRRAFTGTSTFTGATNNEEWHDRFRYEPFFDAFLVCPSGTTEMEAWKL